MTDPRSEVRTPCAFASLVAGVEVADMEPRVFVSDGAALRAVLTALSWAPIVTTAGEGVDAAAPMMLKSRLLGCWSKVLNALAPGRHREAWGLDVGEHNAGGWAAWEHCLEKEPPAGQVGT